ncbi:MULTISPECIES: hypothetical protein [Streptomyces]|uniref:Uncharacterized protein n=1 Tax=Streptomyces luteosporeus TaxID=173856 RepID=A0ABN3TX57_9ACTN
MTTLPLDDAARLLAELKAGTWEPTELERDFAEDLARAGLSASSLRAGLRAAPPGLLAAVLEPVTIAMEHTVPAVNEEELQVLRQLLDRAAPAP